jgi:hypothetical protein
MNVLDLIGKKGEEEKGVIATETQKIRHFTGLEVPGTLSPTN